MEGKHWNSKKKSYEIPNSEGKKLEFVDFSLIGPVSNPFTNYFAISLKNSCVRRKHRIKILKTVCPRYCNYLGHTVFRFPICNTGPVKKFFETKSKKKH